jgi:hypothetical protein
VELVTRGVYIEWLDRVGLDEISKEAVVSWFTVRCSINRVALWDFIFKWQGRVTDRVTRVRR